MHLSRGFFGVFVVVFAVALCLVGCSTTPPVSSAPTTPATPISQPRITGMRAEALADNMRIMVQTTEAVKYTAFVVADPPQVVVDVADVVLDGVPPAMPLEGALASQVDAFVLADANAARFVVHLKRPAAYNVAPQQEGFLITLMPASTRTVAQNDQAPQMSDGRALMLPENSGATAMTLVTHVAVESHSQHSVVVIETAGAIPQVRVKQRQNPPRLTLDIPQARLTTRQEPRLAVADPGQVITQLDTIPMHDRQQERVEVVIHLQHEAPFEIQQEAHLVRLAVVNQDVQMAPNQPMVSALPVMMNTSTTVPTGLPALTNEMVSNETLMTPPMVAQMSPGMAPMAAEMQPPQYTGEKISLDFQGADINDILRLIAEVSGLNIIASGDVQGTVTTRMVDVPWDQALDVILKINNLGQEREGNIIRVAPRAQFAREREERVSLEKVEKEAEPVITKVVPINYSAADSLRGNLEKLLSNRGTIFIDARTNNMIITDTQKNLDDVLALIATLDRPTPQVMIEARIVESTRTFMRDLGVQIGLAHQQVTDQSFPSTITVQGGVTPTDSQGGGGLSSGVASPPANFLLDLPAAVASGSGGAIGFALTSIGGSIIDVQLSALEASGRGKVISSPRIATLDNTEALIQSGRRIPYETRSEEGTVTEFVDASISLKVTPHVTPNDYISMKINATRNAADFANTSVGGVPTIITREATTEMLVKDGDTVVIGGLYTRDIAETRDGVPFLQSIPVLGWLFQRNSNLDETNELLVFITPRIIRAPREFPGKTRAVVR